MRRKKVDSVIKLAAMREAYNLNDADIDLLKRNNVSLRAGTGKKHPVIICDMDDDAPKLLELMQRIDWPVVRLVFGCEPT